MLLRQCLSTLSILPRPRPTGTCLYTVFKIRISWEKLLFFPAPCTRQIIGNQKAAKLRAHSHKHQHCRSFLKLYSKGTFWGGKVYTFRIEKFVIFSLLKICVSQTWLNIRLLTQGSPLKTPFWVLKTKSMKWHNWLVDLLDCRISTSWKWLLLWAPTSAVSALIDRTTTSAPPAVWWSGSTPTGLSQSSYMPMVTNISMSLIFQNLIHKACSRVKKFSFCLQG